MSEQDNSSTPAKKAAPKKAAPKKAAPKKGAAPKKAAAPAKKAAAPKKEAKTAPKKAAARKRTGKKPKQAGTGKKTGKASEQAPEQGAPQAKAPDQSGGEILQQYGNAGGMLMPGINILPDGKRLYPKAALNILYYMSQLNDEELLCLHARVVDMASLTIKEYHRYPTNLTPSRDVYGAVAGKVLAMYEALLKQSKNG